MTVPISISLAHMLRPEDFDSVVVFPPAPPTRPMPQITLARNVARLTSTFLAALYPATQVFFHTTCPVNLTPIGDDSTCPICIDPLEEEIVITECCHLFHKACLKEAFKSSHLCPLDRKKITNVYSWEKPKSIPA